MAMTNEVFEILRVAVNLARNEQIQRLATLKRRLLALYPGKDAEVDEALSSWANHARRFSST